MVDHSGGGSFSSSLTSATVSSKSTAQSGEINANWGWRSILLLQFQIQFSLAIAVSIIISFVVVSTEAAYALGTDPSQMVVPIYDRLSVHILYAFDVVYFVDLVLMSIYKRLLWRDLKLRYKPRHDILVLLEYVSMIPFDGIYYTLTTPSLVVLYGLRLRYVLRIFRVYTYYAAAKRIVAIHMYLLHIVVVVFAIVLLVTVAGSFVYVYICRSWYTCKYYDEELMMSIIYEILTKVTTMGSTTNETLFGIRSIFIAGLILAVCNMYMMCNFTSDIVTITHERITLMNHYQRFKARLLTHEAEIGREYIENFVSHVDKAYAFLWSQKKGIHQADIISKYLPEVKYKEIMLDIAWNALNHSHFFRNLNVNFLRHLSTMLEYTYMTPGETIYCKGEYKSKLVYIISGVVQVLSEEDNETPIISFTDGTCLGESCLFIDYRATSSLICKGFCDLVIINKKNFIQTSSLYPDVMRNFLATIKKRYRFSKHYKILTRLQLPEHHTHDEMNMKWLKYTLRKLLSQEITSDDPYLLQELERLVFCTKYLDMLVIAQEFQLITDSVFLTTKFPYILQPNSVVLKGWNRFIGCLYLVFCLLYLYTISVALEVTNMYVAFHLFVSCLWILDVVIDISTAIKTNESFLITVKEITAYRTKDISFFLNVLSAFSPGILLIAVEPNASRKMIIAIECNKLFKIYKVEQLFQSIVFKSTLQMVVLVYIKYTVYLLLLLYLTASFWIIKICFDDYCDKQFRQHLNNIGFVRPIDVIHYAIYVAIRFICNLKMRLTTFHSCEDLLVLQCIYFLFQLVFTAYRTAADALRRYEMYTMSDLTYRLLIILKCFKVMQLYKEQALIIIKLQIRVDSMNFLYGKDMYKDLPKRLAVLLRTIYFKNSIEKIPLFYMVDKKIISEVACRAHIYMLHRGTLIVLEGEISNEMYVIMKGSCIATSQSGNQKTLVAGDSFSVMETCMQSTSLITVCALTTCKLLALDIRDLVQISVMHPDFCSNIKQAVDEFKQNRAILKSGDGVAYLASEKDSTVYHTWIFFGAHRRQEFRKPFPKWAYGLQFVIMPLTFTMYGTFVRVWELCRCAFALVTIMLIPLQMMFDSSRYWFLIVLDISAWLDIYVRHHISYVNEKDIEITHPYVTAVHYWKTSFVVDLIAAFPFDWYYYVITGNDSIPFIYRANRIFQIYRFVGVLKYYSLFQKDHIKIVETCKYLAITVIALSTTTAVCFNLNCSYTDHELLCDETTVAMQMNGNEPVYYYRIFGLFYLFVTSVITNSFYKYESIPNVTEQWVTTIMGLFGYLFWGYVASNIIAISLTTNFSLISYQDAMRELVTFMNYRRIDIRLKRTIIAHFEYLWHKKEGHTSHGILAVFPLPYRKQLLYKIFGLKLLRSNVFESANESIIRSIVLIARHFIILQTGIIYKVNDIHSNLHFIYKGKVEVIGPDGNHLLFLKEGSFIGNLDNVPRSRMTLTMTAYGHIEILTFSSVEFHAVLSKHKNVYRQFVRSTYVNVDYIENEIDANLAKPITKKVTRKPPKKVFEQTLLIRVYLRMHVIVAAIGFLVEIYHIVSLDHSPVVVFLLYFFDVVFVVKILLKFRIAVLDEFGILSTNKYTIAKRYKKQSFYYDLISVIPIEVFAFVFFAYDITMFKTIWSYLRVNRTIRIGYTIVYYKNQSKKLNTNAFWVRTSHITLICIVCQVLIASFLYFVDSFYEDFQSLTGLQKMGYFLWYWRIILEMVMKATISYDVSSVPTFTAYALVICMVSARFVYMFYMANVISNSQIVSRCKHLYVRYAEKLRIFMTTSAVTRPLYTANTEYLNSLWSQYGGVHMPSLLNEAPYYLREAVLNSMFGVHLRKHPVFSKCHVDLIRQISACFVPRVFFPGNMVTYDGDIDHCMYFIHEGAVEVLWEDSLFDEKVEDNLGAGEMFGFDQGIYQRVGHEGTYKVSVKAFILVLRRESWIKLLDFYPASKLHLYDPEKDI